MSNKMKSLLGNSVIFTIGNLGSKFILFLMLPLYTHVLSSSEYGVTDLVQTTINLLIPIVFLSISDAVLRFGMEKNSKVDSILSNSLFIYIICSFLISMIFWGLWVRKVEYSIYIWLILLTQGLQIILSQYSKAINRTRLFAANGIIVAFCTAGCNIVFMYFLNYKVPGFFYSIIIANIVSNFFLLYKLRIFKRIKFKLIEKIEIKKILKFSIPLIPNSIAWWTSNTINRYFILIFLGSTSNGMFAVANKIPALLSTLNSIFFQSWQLSAIEDYEDTTKDGFQSLVFKRYSQFIFIGTSMILFILKPLIRIIVSNNFYLSWKYVPFLLLTVVYSSFSGFLGQNYIAAKKTNSIFFTTIISAIINVGLNLILIPSLGLNGSGLSSMISFLFLWIYRQLDSQKYVALQIDIGNIVANHILIFFQIATLYLDSLLSSLFFGVASLFAILFINRDTLVVFLSVLRKRKIKN